jgi:hypothetical protein
MRQTQETLRQENTTSQSTMYIAFELSNTTWKLAFSDGNKTRYLTVTARDLTQLEDEIDKAKKRFILKKMFKSRVVMRLAAMGSGYIDIYQVKG